MKNGNAISQVFYGLNNLAVMHNTEFLGILLLSLLVCLRYCTRTNPSRSKLLFPRDLPEAERVLVDPPVLTPLHFTPLHLEISFMWPLQNILQPFHTEIQRDG